MYYQVFYKALAGKFQNVLLDNANLGKKTHVFEGIKIRI